MRNFGKPVDKTLNLRTTLPTEEDVKEDLRKDKD